MRILSWNILQGGGKRSHDIADAIQALQPDIAVLQEFRNSKAAVPILDAIKALGLSHVHRASSDARKNTVMMASRYPLSIAPVVTSLDDDLLFCARIEYGSELNDELTVFAGHLPQKKKQIPYLDALYQLDVKQFDKAMIIGDINCGIPYEDSDTKSFDNTHIFQSILGKGWIDSWRSRNKSAKEFSWVSSRGNGYRYDHCLCTPQLDECIELVTYKHALRGPGLSDHSALVLDIK